MLVLNTRNLHYIQVSLSAHDRPLLGIRKLALEGKNVVESVMSAIGLRSAKADIAFMARTEPVADRPALGVIKGFEGLDF